jgi:hypothetical protein
VILCSQAEEKQAAVEISAGLNGDASLVVNSTNDVHEEAQVHAVAVPQKAK